jgi:hypothetical protein
LIDGEHRHLQRGRAWTEFFLFENLQPGNSQKSNSQWTEINYLFEFRTGGVTSNGQMYHKHNHQD